jgi:translation elongation factor EF-1alpha
MKVRIENDIDNGFTAYYNAQDQTAVHKFLAQIPGIFLIDEDTMNGNPNTLFLEFSIAEVSKRRLQGYTKHVWTEEHDNFIKRGRQLGNTFTLLADYFNQSFQTTLTVNAIQQRDKTLRLIASQAKEEV